MILPIHLKLTKYGKRRDSKILLCTVRGFRFFFGEKAGVLWNSPFIRAKGKDKNSLVKARILRLEQEWLFALMQDILPINQCPSIYNHHTINSQIPCCRPAHSAWATEALLPVPVGLLVQSWPSFGTDQGFAVTTGGAGWLLHLCSQSHRGGLAWARKTSWIHCGSLCFPTLIHRRLLSESCSCSFT